MKRNRRRRGQILVEFALATPLLLGLLFGAMHFGYAFYTYNNLEKAVRDGARYAASLSYGSTTFNPPQAGYLAAVRNVVRYGRPDGSGSLIVHGLTEGQVDVTITPSGTTPFSVRVAINSYTMSLPLGNVTLTNKPSATFRYFGRFAPPMP